MSKHILYAAAAACVLAVGSAAAQDAEPAKVVKPHAVVHDLYFEDTTQTVEPDKILVADVAAALKAPNKVDFDYRFDAKAAAGGLDVVTETVAADSARVRADFFKAGKAGKVVYNICKTGEGAWRVKDAAVPGKWTLRGLLSLPAAETVAGC